MIYIYERAKVKEFYLLLYLLYKLQPLCVVLFNI